MSSHTLTNHTSHNSGNAVANHITSPAVTADEKALVPDDKRPQAITQRKLHDIANDSPQVKQLRAVQAMANDHAAHKADPGAIADNKQLEKGALNGNNDKAPVQRAISVEGHTINDGKVDKVHAFLDALDKAVLKAHTYIMNVPLLGGAYNVDGYTNLWVERWKAYDKDGDTDMIHAAFGYAVESIATLVYMPDPPAGMHILLQEPRPGTRPDVILRDDLSNLDVAWLDITSDGKGSERHILTAKVLWEKQPHYGEVTYPAVKDSDLIAMKSAPGVFDDKIDKEEFYRKRMFARYLHDVRMKHWYELGQERFNEPLKTKGGDKMIRAIGNRTDIIQRMSDYFGIQFTSKMAASVLYVMDIGRGKFGLEDSVSMGLGQSILLRHDPNLPNIPLPKNSIPQSMPMGKDEIDMFSKMNMPPPSLAPSISPSLPQSNMLVPFSQGSQQQQAPSFNFNFDPSMFGNQGGFGSQGIFGNQGGFNFGGMQGFGQQGRGSEMTPFREKPVTKKSMQEKAAKLLEKVMKMRYFTPKQMSVLHDLLKKAQKKPLAQFRILKAVIKNDRGELMLLEKDLSKPLFTIKRLKRGRRGPQQPGGLPMPGMQMGQVQMGMPLLNFGMQTIDAEPIELDEDTPLEIVALMLENGDEKVAVGNIEF